MSDHFALAWSFGMLIAVVAGFSIYYKVEEEGLVTILKRRAAAVICVGLAILAAGVFLQDSNALGYDFRDFSRDGYVAFFGAALTLIGVYFWLAGSPGETGK